MMPMWYNGLFITRLVRRIPNPWSLDALGSVEITPQECAFATLGARLYAPKRLMPQTGDSARALLPGMVAPKHMETVPETPDEAASEPPTPFIPMPALGLGSGLTTPLPPSSVATQQGSSSTPTTKGTTIAMKAPPASAALAAPASPRGGSVSREAEASASGAASTEIESPFKRARITLISGTEYEHEDDQDLTTFTDADVDQLDLYDHEMQGKWEEWDTDDLELNGLMQHLIFPFSEQEPVVSAAELEKIDSIAEQVETSRLVRMGVLLPIDSVDLNKAKRLSTRFVITWRSKVLDGKPCWLRRARFVAREYSWLTPERQDLFSPASSSTVRLLPSLYLYLLDKYPQQKFVLVSMDIGDAFLCVDQAERCYLWWPQLRTG